MLAGSCSHLGRKLNGSTWQHQAMLTDMESKVFLPEPIQIAEGHCLLALAQLQGKHRAAW
jgi:hypothetical protein